MSPAPPSRLFLRRPRDHLPLHVSARGSLFDCPHGGVRGCRRPHLHGHKSRPLGHPVSEQRQSLASRFAQPLHGRPLRKLERPQLPAATSRPRLGWPSPMPPTSITRARMDTSFSPSRSMTACRRIRTGPTTSRRASARIIPVNLINKNITPPDQDLVVVWYHTNALGVAWADSTGLPPAMACRQ